VFYVGTNCVFSKTLPLRVRALPQFTVPAQTGATIAAEGFRFTLTGSLNQFYLLEYDSSWSMALLFGGWDGSAALADAREYRCREVPAPATLTSPLCGSNAFCGDARLFYRAHRCTFG
jgi:hypothetical protein